MGGEPSGWLDFSANLRPEGTPDWVMRAMQAALCNARYYPDRALRAARAGLAAYAGVPEACILPTAGGVAAIDLCMALHPGRVRTEVPAFGEYAERAAAHHREHVLWDGCFASGDLLIIGNPNNPTGSVRSRAEILALHAQAMHSGAALAVDEAFIDFCPEHSVRRDVSQGLTVVGSLTKTLCIPGVRLGYICAAPEVIAQMERQALPWSLNMLAAEIAAQLPAHMEDIRRDAERSAQRRERLAGMLRAHGARVEPSQANFLLVDFGRDMSAEADRLKRHHILVRTCASFGLGKNVLRLAVRTDAENDRLVDALWAKG
ncbi:MAG: pyridoxal phosphate-dependent aminotransferase [Candidatus Ventricola sp.]